MLCFVSVFVRALFVLSVCFITKHICPGVAGHCTLHIRCSSLSTGVGDAAFARYTGRHACCSGCQFLLQRCDQGGVVQTLESVKLQNVNLFCSLVCDSSYECDVNVNCVLFARTLLFFLVSTFEMGGK